VRGFFPVEFNSTGKGPIGSADDVGRLPPGLGFKLELGQGMLVAVGLGDLVAEFAESDRRFIVAKACFESADLSRSTLTDLDSLLVGQNRTDCEQSESGHDQEGEKK
jgi:hypothetical protein